jgi:hypothetical protein
MMPAPQAQAPTAAPIYTPPPQMGMEGIMDDYDLETQT